MCLALDEHSVNLSIQLAVPMFTFGQDVPDLNKNNIEEKASVPNNEALKITKDTPTEVLKPTNKREFKKV